MDWSKGYTARYYATIIDPVTWSDISQFDISGGSIKCTDSGLRQTADLNCGEFDASKEHWVRIYMDVSQSRGGSMLIPLFTGLTSLPSTSKNGRRVTNTIQCNSILQVANDILLPLGWSVSAGSNGARVVKELLSDILPSPIEIIGDSPSISETIVAESGETRLSIIDYILDVINWRMKIKGDGTIVICGPPSERSATFDTATYDMIELDVSVENNWFECPNVFRAVSNDMMAIARDEDPNSPLSIPNRGREIWREDTSCTLNEGETIGQYAQRRLKEEQMVSYTISYNRRYYPDVCVSDAVYIKDPEQDIEGLFTIQSQTINLTFGAQVNEQVTM